MGQGTESCGGYEIDYDPYDFRESGGYEYWTERSGAQTKISNMSDRHIRNTIRMCKNLSACANFTCESEKWDEWVDVLEGELYDRSRSGRVVKDPPRKKSDTPLPRPEKKDTWTGKKENLSPNKTAPVAKGRGSKLDLVCWCGTEYKARIADLKRGWGMSCCKSCAAIKRDFKRKDPVCAKTKKSVKVLLNELK